MEEDIAAPPTLRKKNLLGGPAVQGNSADHSAHPNGSAVCRMAKATQTYLERALLGGLCGSRYHVDTIADLQGTPRVLAEHIVGGS